MSTPCPTPSPNSPASLAVCRRNLTELVSRADDLWADVQWRQEIAACRGQAASALFHALQAGKSADDLEQAGAMLTQLNLCGANDFAASLSQVAEARDYVTQGWPGVAAASLLIPCWQEEFMPHPRGVPLWLLPFYATRGFSLPRLLTAEGQAQAVARVYLSTLESLVEVAEANRGSHVAQRLIERFRATECCSLLTLDPVLHAAIRALRARLAAALHRQPGGRTPVKSSRSGGPLRLGIITQQVGDTPAAHALFRLVERLPRERIALTLLSTQPGQSRVERELIQQASSFTVTGSDLDQLAFSVQEANLDVGIFLVEGPWLDNPVAQLALQRVLPLQIIHDGTGLPSGLPGADLFTAAPYAVPSRQEQGCLLAPGGMEGTGGIVPEEKPEPWTRNTIGIEGDGVVYGHFGEISLITPEFTMAWARILAAVPQSRLVLVGPAEPGFRTDRFCASLAATLADHGVGLERVSIFDNVTLATHAERQAAVAVFDVILESTPVGTAGISLAALEEARPLLTLSQPHGTAAALLQQANVSELVVASLEPYVAQASRLGLEPDFRAGLGSRLAEQGRPVLLQHDAFALGESLALTLEAALAAKSDSAKAQGTTPRLLTPQLPASPAKVLEEASLFQEVGSLPDAERRLRSLLPSTEQAAASRRQLASVLNLQGKYREATDLLSSVVALHPGDPELWIELSATARRAGLHAIGIDALQTAVRIDPRRLESWQHLAELAREANQTDLLPEIEEVLRHLGAPNTEPDAAHDLRTAAAGL
jgi:predicted O-linked N-acetylglucosamine transferase (SPINDLY family)